MIQNISEWTDRLTALLKEAFQQRLLFVGLQGSYQRNEATEESDIDIVAVLEHLSVEDLDRYQALVRAMPHSEKACGFICGKKELLHWPGYDLFQLAYDTKPLFGELAPLLKEIRPGDAAEAVRISSANLYHGACHSYLYSENRGRALADLYKAVFFILQAKYFYENGNYISEKKTLLPLLQAEDRQLLDICLRRKELFCSPAEEKRCFKLLLQWCGKNLEVYGRIQ